MAEAAEAAAGAEAEEEEEEEEEDICLCMAASALGPPPPPPPLPLPSHGESSSSHARLGCPKAEEEEEEEEEEDEEEAPCGLQADDAHALDRGNIGPDRPPTGTPMLGLPPCCRNRSASSLSTEPKCPRMPPPPILPTPMPPTPMPPPPPPPPPPPVWARGGAAKPPVSNRGLLGLPKKSAPRNECRSSSMGGGGLCHSAY